MTSAPLILTNRFTKLCLRSRQDGLWLEDARSLAAQPGFDWNTTMAFIESGGVSPLLYDCLRHEPIAPPSVLGALHDHYAYTARRNLYLLHELGLCLNALSAARLPAIVLKGAALAEVVYGNVALRPMTDLDLLVRREHFPALADLLASLGYSQDDGFNDAGTLTFENAIPFTRHGVEQVVLDVHWNLFSWIFYSQTLPLEWFWDTALVTGSDPSPAAILGPEAQVLYLCGHLSKHQLPGHDLLWLNDIAEVIRFYHSELDWDLLLDQAQSCHLVLSVQRVLSRVAHDLGAPVPGELLARVMDLTPSPAEAREEAFVNAGEHTMAHRVKSDLLNLSTLRQRIRYVATFVLGHIFAPPGYMMARYHIRNRSLLPFYYLHRLISNLRAGLRFLLHRRDGRSRA